MYAHLTNAITACSQALWNGAELTDSCRTLGNVLQALGRFDEAVDWHARAIQPQPDRAELFASLGRLYAQQQQWTEAIATYQQTLRLQPNHAGAYWSLANIYAQLGKVTEEAECRQRAMKMKPEWSTAQNQCNLGNLLMGQNRLAAAVEAYQSALRHQPDFRVAQYNLAVVFTLQGKLSEAIEAYQRTLAIDPHYHEAYFGMGKVREQQQQWQVAADCYRRAVELKSDVASRYALGRLLLQQGDWQDLVTTYREQIEQHPDCAWSHYYLGYALLKQGKLTEAVVMLRRSIDLNSDSPWAYHHLTTALWQLQRPQEAIEVGRQSIEKYPDFVWTCGLVGSILSEQGEIQAAIELNRRANVLHGWQQAGEKNYEFTRDWFTHNIPTWNQHLLSLAHTPHLNVLEIGSYEGRSACWFLDHLLTHPTSQLTCIDIAFQARFDQNLDRTGAKTRVKKLRGNSLDLLPTLQPQSYDLIYIDGCHLASHVAQETKLCWQLLKPGSMMIFDDYEFHDPAHPAEDPKPAIDQFLKAEHSQLKVLHQGYQVIVQKTV